jgi:rubrerythrin
MAYDFNADEIFEMAEQMERNGAKFYRDAAEGVSSPGEKEWLLQLAQMEDAHEKVFQTIRADLTAGAKTSSVFDPQGESALYLKALVDTKVFYEKDIDTSSMHGILKAAIQAEKDSIVFYLGMKEAVAMDKGKARIEDIIKEEMGHIRLLSRELVALGA